MAIATCATNAMTTQPQPAGLGFFPGTWSRRVRVVSVDCQEVGRDLGLVVLGYWGANQSAVFVNRLATSLALVIG